MKSIPYGKQEITDDDVRAVVETLKSDFLTQGPKVEEFESQFAAAVDARYAVACANGTAALHLAALVLGADNKSHFIVPAITFAASANCILYCGGKIGFCDIDPKTGLIDLEKLEAMIEKSPKGFYTGVVAVHLAGYPVDMERLAQICSTYSLVCIEDACHAPGAYFTDSYGQKQVCGNGKYSDVAIFSFHPVKHITSGEGGMVTTNQRNLYDRMKKLRTHGITRDVKNSEGPWYYEMQELGYNYRISDILCALGISQLKRLDQNLSRRHEIAKKYDRAFQDHPQVRFLTPYGASDLQKHGVFHAYHLYIIKVPNRLKIYESLASKNIFCQVHYIPVYRLPYYQNIVKPEYDCPEADRYYEKCLSIPIYSSLTDSEQNFVIDSILQVYK